jgi:hypothetical protein
MAEGILRQAAGDFIDVQRAGSRASFVACAIKSSWSSRLMPLVCVKAQAATRRSSQPDPPVQKPAWQVTPKNEKVNHEYGKY